MLINEQFDADDILRDADEKFIDKSDGKSDGKSDRSEDMEELEFGSPENTKSHYEDLASEMDNAEDLWE